MKICITPLSNGLGFIAALIATWHCVLIQCSFYCQIIRKIIAIINIESLKNVCPIFFINNNSTRVIMFMEYVLSRLGWVAMIGDWRSVSEKIDQLIYQPSGRRNVISAGRRKIPVDFLNNTLCLWTKLKRGNNY